MKEIDNKGLLLCDLQSELFEYSICLECSSEIFIRRFMHSKVANRFDTLQILDSINSKYDILDELLSEYGKINYGSLKYSKNQLYWIGHFYRYLCYTYEISSKQAYKIIKPKELKTLFKAYHTLDTKHAIERVLEAKNIVLDDYTEMILKILRRLKENEYVYKKTLSQEVFENIKTGCKTIELNMNEDELVRIKIGDIINFTNICSQEKLKVKVNEVNYFKDNNSHKKMKLHFQVLE